MSGARESSRLRGSARSIVMRLGGRTDMTEPLTNSRAPVGWDPWSKLVSLGTEKDMTCHCLRCLEVPRGKQYARCSCWIAAAGREIPQKPIDHKFVQRSHASPLMIRLQGTQLDWKPHWEQEKEKSFKESGSKA